MSTLAGPFKKVLTANSTASSFTALTMTTTKPSGDGVTDRSGDAIPSVPDVATFVFFGAGADNATFVARLVGWRYEGAAWLPITLIEVTCTLSTMVGVANGNVTASERIVDTIVQTAAFDDLAGISFRIVSPADNTPARLLVDLEGWTIREWKFDMTGATNGNVLEAGL